MLIDILYEDGDCDDLYRPRSFAVAVEKEMLNDLEQVQIDGQTFQLEE